MVDLVQEKVLDAAEVKQVGDELKTLEVEVQKRIVGQRQLIRRLISALLTEGHVLLEGLPGLAKTSAVRTLAQACHFKFSRIQFTPDLLPADVIGTQIYDPSNASFRVKRGPVFANLILADEINRAPAKVQSALLEAMQERQVTIGDESFPLSRPFMVLATQNPIEQQGTYALPEAQLDRFMFKVSVGHGSLAEEEEIVRRMASGTEPPIGAVYSEASLTAARRVMHSLRVAPEITKYIVRLVCATRQSGDGVHKEIASLVQWGASPRASIFLERAARAEALLDGRSYVVPDDVKAVARDVLVHRIVPTYEAEGQGISSRQVVDRLLELIPLP